MSKHWLFDDISEPEKLVKHMMDLLNLFLESWNTLVSTIPPENVKAHEILEEIDQERKKMVEKLGRLLKWL